MGRTRFALPNEPLACRSGQSKSCSVLAMGAAAPHRQVDRSPPQEVQNLRVGPLGEHRVLERRPRPFGLVRTDSKRVRSLGTSQKKREREGERRIGGSRRESTEVQGHDDTATHSTLPTKDAPWPTLERLKKLAEKNMPNTITFVPYRMKKMLCSSPQLEDE